MVEHNIEPIEIDRDDLSFCQRLARRWTLAVSDEMVAYKNYHDVSERLSHARQLKRAYRRLLLLEGVTEEELEDGN